MLGNFPANIVIHFLAVGGDTGDYHPGGQRNQQRRDLGNQAVADSQYRVNVHRVTGSHAVLQHTDGEAAYHVDKDDHQACDGIAFDEFHRAVHRAEQLTLFGEIFTPLTGLLGIDQPGAQVTVDRHLFAGHGIKGKARGDFGDALGAFGDNQKVHHRQDQEDDQPHRQIAAHHEVAEGFHHMPGVLLQQDLPGGGDRQGQPKHGGQQQHCRKGRERQRFGQVHRQHNQQ